ncbi:MAG: glycosyltransferase [Candidatus Eisenbacteria bacterium]|nr:glycosyltransferase [Candidatus Eisenbacteria bacterium]
MKSRRMVRGFCRLGEKSGVFPFVTSRVGPLISGPQASIVTFHDVWARGDELSYGISPEALEESIRYVTKHFNVVPLSHVLDAIEGKRELTPPALAITFDDGRRSFLTHAVPVLRNHGVSAAVSIVTKTLEPSFVIWTDLVEELVACLENVRLPKYLDYVESLETGTFPLKRAAVIRLKAYLRYLPARRRQAAVRELLRVNDVKERELPCSRLYLSREDVLQLLESGMEICSHSHSHEVFSLLSKEEARSELLTSKHILEEIAGKKVDCFAFPSGTRADFRPLDVSLAREAGYRAVLSTVRGVVRLSSGAFLLPRIEAPGGYEELPLPVFSCLSAVESVLCAKRERTLKSLAAHDGRINVLYVIDSLHPQYAGGTETQLESTISNADRDLVNPFLCTLRGVVTSDFKCPVTILGVAKLLDPGFVSGLWRLTRLMRKQRINVVHLSFFDSVVLGTLAARLARVPVIITSRRGIRSLAFTWPQVVFVRMLDTLATCVLSNSHAVEESVRADEKIPRHKALVIHNGMVAPQGVALPAHEAKLGLELKPGELCVGMVANLRYVKGVDVFIAAASVVFKEEPLSRFCIFGEGELREELENLASSLGIAGAVTFFGFRRDAHTLIPGFDVAVISSRSEGCANALLEYCSAGSAIVATDVGGNAEIVADCESGLLVQSDDPAMLGRGILRLLRDSHLRTWLGSHARMEADQKFLFRDALRQLWCLYWRLMQPRSGSIPKGS